MDILNNYKGTGNKNSGDAPAEGVANATPDNSSTKPAAANAELGRGQDMISKMNSKEADSTAAANSNQTSADANKSASSKVEPSGSEGGNSESPDWTVDSAYKEIKKLREENKAYRIKYAEQLDKLRQDADARLQAKEEEAKALLEAKKELDRIKEEQEDKKRDLSERLANRESKLSEMQSILKIKEEQYQKMIQEKENLLMQYEAERKAESEVYQSRLSEELNRIPEQYREYANLLVKGAGDPRDALVALNEARLKGMFEDKTVVVNHNVPGARDGARASQERLKEVERQQRASMSSKDKIKTALEQIKGGQSNTMFRTK